MTNKHAQANAVPQPPAAEAKHFGWPVICRGIGIFLVFAILAVGLFWFCLHHYKNVATWSGIDNPRDTLVYQEKTFHLASKLGDPGLTTNKYSQGDLLGEVTPDGKPSLKGAATVYAVLGSRQTLKEDYLMVVYEDGIKYIYYLDGIENPYLGPTEPENEDWWFEEDPEE